MLDEKADNRLIAFVCGGKDFHAMDKFHLTAKTLGYDKVLLITDSFESEHQKSLIKRKYYKVIKLYILDQFIPTDYSMISNIWRNVLKIVILPFQVMRLRHIYKKYKFYIIHATPIYYMLLCYFSSVPYIGTPQASEILQRADKSKLYKYFSKKAITGANKIIVDSISMRDKIKKDYGIDSLLIKNGFDVSLALNFQNQEKKRSRVLSLRSFFSDNRINNIILARNRSAMKQKIDFIFPQKDKNYLNNITKIFSIDDEMHGMLPKEKLYSLMSETILAISIPISDSSPRSVYESIFCGSIVAMTYAAYYEELPDCMRKRIYLVDIENKNWFDEALNFAKSIEGQRFIPTTEALDMCDQMRLINKVIKNAYDL